MKKVFIFFLIPVCFAACNNKGAGTTAATATDSTAVAAVKFPYTASYSSNFVPGKQSDVLTVLNSYKDWETGDSVALKSTFGDSITFLGADGMVLKGSNDSVIAIFNKYRDSLSKVVLDVFAWTSNHSVDKNQDWVNIWYKETDTYKMGKVDSAIFEDDNRLENGKIVWASSHRQKLKP